MKTKFKIGDKVIIVNGGKIQSKTIEKIEISITEESTNILYFFDKYDYSGSLFNLDNFSKSYTTHKKEDEVFKTVQDLVDNIGNVILESDDKI